MLLRNGMFLTPVNLPPHFSNHLFHSAHILYTSSYALTLRIMLANLRRKIGMGPGPGPLPGLTGGPSDTIVALPPQQQPPAPFVDPSGAPAPFTMEELGFSFPNNQQPPPLSANDIPIWLQEQVRTFIFIPVSSFSKKNRFSLHISAGLLIQSLTDLGLPVNGSDGIFMNLTRASGWPGEFAPMPEAW
jgi:hypothetical protein